jgi:uncharacterized membrane protein (DUF485 family)
MDEELVGRIEANPSYQHLVRRRSRLGWLLTTAMVTAFLAFILAIAFDKPLLAAPIGTGVMSVGIPIGFGLILLGIALTALYVWRANAEFDRLTQTIRDEVGA